MSDTLQKGHQLPALCVPIITQAQIDAYLLASGDDNPVHSDRKLALQAGLADIAVPGMLIMAYMAQCVRQWRRCENVEKFSARFVSPALVNKDIATNARVVVINQTANSAIVRITAKQDAKLVAIGEARVNLIEADGPDV